MLAQEIIRIKRDGGTLADPHIDAFVRGLVTRSWSEGQVAALAMAILLRGMTRAECVSLTRAMTRSGQVLDWRGARLPGPVVDKHSTGGVGDKVSLLLAPWVAACGGVVPMVSGRGLGHTGGTLDKLAALPGYHVAPGRVMLLRALREAGCAIVGASARLAPADRRLYAVRDVTATVESVPLITASILSKKLSAGLQALVMDVKVGSGAFCATLDDARTLAESLVEVACSAGLPTEALITDMNQVLGTSAGNALEVAECLDVLAGRHVGEPRLLAVTMALAARLLVLGGLAADLAAAEAALGRALASGAVAERFARMVAALGGPADVLAAGRAGLARAPFERDVVAPHAGLLHAMDTRAIGLAIVALGGGRRRASDRIDPAVGYSAIKPLGCPVGKGEPIARVHAASADAAEAGAAAWLAAVHIGEGGQRGDAPVVLEVIEAERPAPGTGEPSRPAAGTSNGGDAARP